MTDHSRPFITTTYIGDLLIDAVPILETNYLWVIRHKHRSGAYILDPGESKPIIHYLTSNQVELNGVLMTHSHWDHINGLDNLLEWQLKQGEKIEVHGPKCKAIPQVTQYCQEGGDILLWDSVRFSVLETPGHLPEHLSYYSEAFDIPLLFCADTLFSSGCGRIFVGTPGELKSSLDRFKQMRPETLVFCSHEYTINNLGFAKEVEPGNTDLDNRLAEVNAMLEQSKPSLPTSILIERLHNPFLRCDQPEIAQSVTRYAQRKYTSLCPPLSELDIFTYLRQWKDEY